MLTIPALKVQQFAREFYLVNLAANDVDRLVRFEVLGEGGVASTTQSPKRPRSATSRVNWGLLESRVGTSDKAFQRPIVRKKIDELVEYYLSCRDQDSLPAVPGAVILTTDAPVEFAASGANPFVGLVQLSQEEGTLRALDGQHRLLALAALLHATDATDEQRAAARRLQVPAILFAGLPPDHVVEMFVTINAKHTRLNPSLLVSLSGRQLYGDPELALVHDILGKLNAIESSPLAGQIKMLGIGPGKLQQAGLANELRTALTEVSRRNAELAEHFKKEAASFYLAYFKEIARVFDDAWAGRKYSIRSTSAVRAFIQASPEVLQRAVAANATSRTDALRVVLAPWRDRIGSDRFETAGAWRAKVAGGGKETTRLLARELIAALGGSP